MPGDQVTEKDSAILFSSSSLAQRPQTQAKRRNPFFYTFTMEVNSAATKPHSCGRRVRIYPGPASAVYRLPDWYTNWLKILP
jgi:hypothetical protein